MVQMKNFILVALLVGVCSAFPAEKVEEVRFPIARQAGGTIAEALMSAVKPLLETINKGLKNVFRPNGLKKPDERFDTVVMQIPREPIKSAQENPVMSRSLKDFSPEDRSLHENKNFVDKPNKH